VNDQADKIIIHKVLAGDIGAYEVLVDKYRNMVFTLAYNIILNREEAEEAAQDTFVKVFNGLKTFKAESAFATWLYRIVVNTALNKKKLRKFTPATAGDVIVEEYNDISTLLQKCESRDQKKFISLAMRALKDDERICITMFYLNELSVNEIHELTNISASNIKVLLHRGRKHLYDKLGDLLKTEIKDLI
jgi:RNA polymerase sigma-70 factor (ECF subfamily)